MLQKFPKILYVISSIACATLVLSRIWVAEDAYITFRSVENLYSGIGLIFNQGERIEASTHPLWMILLILIRGLGMPLHSGSILMGLLATGTGLGLLIYRDFKNKLPLPITALLLCSISGFRDFSTAGMEYSLVFLLLAIFVSSLDSHQIKDRILYHSSLLGLLYLARPELALLYITYSVFFVFEIFQSAIQPALPTTLREKFKIFFQRQNIIDCTKWVLGFLMTAGVYHLFRGLYYHEIFPNTYYAKAGLSSYYTQGLKYLFVNIIWSPAIIIVGFSLLVFFVRSYRNKKNASDPNHKQLRFGLSREVVAAGIAGFYIIRVGGDFMSFRFLLPEFIILTVTFSRISKEQWILIQEKILNKVTQQKIWQETCLLLFLIALAFWPVPLYKGYIADERRVFTNDGKISVWELLQGQNHKWGKEGRRFSLLASCLGQGTIKITNSMTQAHCMEGVGLGYFGVAAGSTVYILDEQALPNRDVADLPVLYRWRPGHEHYVDLGFVIKSKSLFCSTGEARFEQIMSTRYGTLISLDPELLSTVPRIQDRLKQLLQYKKSSNSPIIERLEKSWGHSIEFLHKQSKDWKMDDLARSKNRCWEPGY